MQNLDLFKQKKVQKDIDTSTSVGGCLTILLIIVNIVNFIVNFTQLIIVLVENEWSEFNDPEFYKEFYVSDKNDDFYYSVFNITIFGSPCDCTY